MLTRRDALKLTVAGVIAAPLALHVHPEEPFSGLEAELLKLEGRSGGRLGVGVLDTGTGRLTGHRLRERFAMCSTCKVLLAAAILQRADNGQDAMARRVAIPAKPLIGHSPLTEAHAGGMMTLMELCHATLTQSDNTAANVLLGVLGGPEAYTRFARSIGDEVTRLDRTETALNEAKPGDARDTTSPAAAAQDLQKLLLGSVLAVGSRKLLLDWMMENNYGAERLRKNVPADWKAADKTGSNGETTGNDIAMYFPAGRAPVAVTAFLTECPGTDAQRGAILAEVGRLVVAMLQKRRN